MKLNLSKVCVSVVMVSSLVFTAFSPMLVAANNAPQINDQLNFLKLKPANNANWWLMNWGPDYNEDGSVSQGRVEGYCGTVTCIQPVKEQGDHFARLTVNPSPEGIYANADMAELHTGFPQEAQGRWNPTVGHPVVMESQVRWSNLYHQDGSGGAVGSNGIWLWNSPIDLNDPMSAMNQTAVGFNWADSNMLGGYLAGLKANVIVQSYPYALNYPTQAVNMQDWVTVKLVWSVDATGVQNVTYYINGENIGTTTLPVALSNLSVEIWNDNSGAEFTADGGVNITHPAVTQTQTFDVNYVKVYNAE